MTEDEARRGFFMLGLLRLTGVAIAFLGIAVIMRRLIEPADIVGTALIAVGAFQVAVLPQLLIRRWKRGK